MSEGISFRGAIGGYNKKDVNEYITKADRDFAEFKELAEKDKARLEGELETAKNEVIKLANAVDEAKAEKAELSEQNEKLSTELKNACDGVSALEAKLSEKDNVLSSVEAELEALKSEKEKTDRMLESANSRLTDIESAEESERDEMYEAISDKLNVLLSAANKEAEDIVTGAMNRSDEIIEDAKCRAEEIVLKATSQAEGLNEKNAENMRQIAKDIAAEYCDEVTMFATELRDSFNALLRDISAKGMEMSGRLDYLSTSVGSDVEKRIIDVADENLLKAGDAGVKAAKKTSTQAALEAINERIDSFVKSAISAIGKITRRNKD